MMFCFLLSQNGFGQDKILFGGFTSGFAETGGNGTKMKISIGLPVDTTVNAGTFRAGFLAYTINVAPPTVPGSFSVTALDTSRMNLQWQPSAGDTAGLKYIVWQSLSRTGSFSHVDSANVSTEGLIESNLSPKTVYFYFMTAKNQWGSSFATDTLRDSTRGRPDKVAGLSGSPVTGRATQISLLWSPSAWNPTQYNIFRSTSSSNGFSFLDSSSSVTYIDSLNLAANTSYYYFVAAKNQFGYSDTSAHKKVMTNDFSIAFTGGQAPSTAVENTAVPVSISLGVTLGTGDGAEVFYKRGGESSYAFTPLTLSGNSYTGNIPLSVVGNRGVSYFVKVMIGASTKFAPSDTSSPSTILVTFPSGFSNPTYSIAGFDQSAYRMISVPLDLDDGSPSGVMADFGTADKALWRLFEYPGGMDAPYIEQDDPNFHDFDAGNGYWLITRNRHTLKATSGKTIATNGAFSVQLLPGYNIIGNPFNFPVAVTSIDLQAGQQLHSYDGSDFPVVSVIVPWEGYGIFNSGTSVQTLHIKPIGSASSKILAKVGKSADYGNFEQNEWQMRIKSSSGIVSDNYNFIGAMNLASDGFGEYDAFESPRQPGGQFLKLYFPHVDWGEQSAQFGYDFRAVNAQGYTWDFEVNTSSKAELVTIELSDFESVPQNFDIMLYDKDLKISKNVRKNNELYFASGKGKEITRHFRIVVGTSEYVSRNDLGIAAVPETFDISQNFPNPFNPTTTFKFSLPVRAQVDIRIYNMLGQEVKKMMSKELSAGYHLAFWDAKNNTGQQVSSGVYIYRIYARGLDGTGRGFVRAKKMMLIK